MMKSKSEEPLFEHDVDADFDDPQQTTHQPLLSVEHQMARHQELTWKKRLCRSLGLALLLLLAVHVVLLLLLRATSIQLQRLQFPNLCQRNSSSNELVLQSTNPSACAPTVGPIDFQVVKKQTPLLRVQLPQFQVAPGSNLLMTHFETQLLVSPKVLHDLVFSSAAKYTGEFELKGAIPVQVQCFLLPFALDLPLGQVLPHPDLLVNNVYLRQPPSFVASGEPTLSPTSMALTNAFVSLERLHWWLKDTDFHDLLDEMVKRILKTISLSHFHVDNDPDQVFAFTDATFNLVSKMIWQIPAFGLQLFQRNAAEESVDNDILIAGFDHFVLGKGKTMISAFTKIAQSKMRPIETMLTQFLGGDDVKLRFQGYNNGSQCYALQVLDQVQVDVTLPGKVDGQNVLLRDYKVQVQLKEIDSISRKCRLDIAVRIDIRNPLPVPIDMFDVRFNLSYWDVKSSQPSKAIFLFALDDDSRKHWGSHQDVNVTLSSELHTFSVCQPLLTTYIQDQLALRIDDGSITLSVAQSSNFSIPFSVKKIRIHPSLLAQKQDPPANAALQ